MSPRWLSCLVFAGGGLHPHRGLRKSSANRTTDTVNKAVYSRVRMCDVLIYENSEVESDWIRIFQKKKKLP